MPETGKAREVGFWPQKGGLTPLAMCQRVGPIHRVRRNLCSLRINSAKVLAVLWPLRSQTLAKIAFRAGSQIKANFRRKAALNTFG